MTTKENIAETIGIDLNKLPERTTYSIVNTSKGEGYNRMLIEFDSELGSDNEKVRAYLLIPDVLKAKNPAILINHQHNGERHLGKSEVCGLAGDPLQGFGHALAQKGFVVLAPDSICFEDRRKNTQGINPLPDDGDWLQHYNEMCYRILKGETLMKTVLADAMNGITLLSGLPFVDKKRICTLGHSYGGNTVLFLSALDERIKYSCTSGSTCTYKNRIANNVGIEMASVIPGFIKKYDVQDLVRCTAPRNMLIVSAEEDKYSKDADLIFEQAQPAYLELDAKDNLQHKRYPGGHALTREQFDFIVAWFTKLAAT